MRAKTVPTPPWHAWNALQPIVAGTKGDSMSPDVEFVDWVLFGTELLNVLRQIRDELQKIGDRLAEGEIKKKA